MPSPFPGMDPYLEAPDVFPDFHQRFAVRLSEALISLLHPPYYARVYFDETTDVLPTGSVKVIYPDVAVARHRRVAAGWWGTERGAAACASTAVAAQVTPAVEVALSAGVKRKQFRIEVLRDRTRELVTAIEIVSRSNKRRGHPDTEAFRAKREAYLARGASYMEIDLLRAGDRWSPPDAPESAYRVLLCRADRAFLASVWPVCLRDRLPVVPVPLRAPDSDVVLDLQAAFAATFDAAGYARDLDYSAPLPPPVPSRADAKWATSLLRPGRPRSSRRQGRR